MESTECSWLGRKFPITTSEGIKWFCGTSLVAQWIRIDLPTQGTQVQFLVWEDSTRQRAMKSVCHNYWASVVQLLKPVCLEPGLHSKTSHHKEKSMATTRNSPCSLQLEKACTKQQRPRSQSKQINMFLNVKKKKWSHGRFSTGASQVALVVKNSLDNSGDMLFSDYHGVGNYEQQSLPRHPLRGSEGSPAWQPAQPQKVFGDGGASDQHEELWLSEGQTFLGHCQA